MFAEAIFNESLISSQLIGNYNRTNILAACEIGSYFGVTLENIKDAIKSYIPSNNRSQLFKTRRNTIILDAYNANPSSMSEAIKAVQKLNHKKNQTTITKLGAQASSQPLIYIDKSQKHKNKKITKLGAQASSQPLFYI